MTTIQVYGEFSSDANWSRGVVSRGIVEGLTAHGIECWCKDIRGICLENPLAGEGPAPAALPKGAHHGTKMPDPPVGLFIGGNPGQIYPRLWCHEVKAALLVFETCDLPQAWLGELDRLDLIAVPSTWCRRVVEAHGFEAMVSSHGLDKAFQRPPMQPYPWSRSLRFVHYACGPADLVDRKGTPQLLEAFADVFADGEHGLAELIVRVPLTARDATGHFRPVQHNAFLFDLLEDLGLPTETCLVSLADALAPLPPAEVAEQLLNPARVLIQPSRVEGFGLMPLQARALGVPVILSMGTGHDDHLETTDVIVGVGYPPAPLEHPGVETLWEATAPTVSAAEIAAALHGYMALFSADRWEAAWETSAGYYERWSWPRQTRALADKIKEIA